MKLFNQKGLMQEDYFYGKDRMKFLYQFSNFNPVFFLLTINLNKSGLQVKT
jgi:hypothetical protein